MINYTILIGGVDYSSSCSLPFKEQFCLDESLDNGVLNVKMIARSARFKPYTIVSITKNDGTSTDTYSYYVANDNVTEIVGTNTYNHDLTLIEETKMLEKIVVDTNTITQPQPANRKYDTRFVPKRQFAYAYYDSNGTYLGTGVSTDYAKTITVDEQFATTPQIICQHSSPSISVTSSNTFQLYFADYFAYADVAITSLNDLQNAHTIEDIDNWQGPLYSLSGKNAVCLVIKGDFTVGSTPVTNGTIVFSGGSSKEWIPIYAIYNTDNDVKKFTITDVVNRLLKISETQRYGETPRFVFNNTQATKYSTVIAPEFAFTKSTLRECLDQVGGYIHAITRLENGVIYFDELGKNNEEKLPNDYLAHNENQDIEQYCTAIDTNVDNIINLDNLEQGSIVSPYINAYKTVRSENVAVRITDENAIIETEYPIQKILKVEVGTLKDETTTVGDITPFIYEEAEYATLSSFDEEYPYSRAYALYYTQGQKNIKGLNFNLPNALGSLFTKPAILNICELLTNQNLQNIINVYGLIHLNFRVTYIPIVDTRIKQSKNYLLDYNTDITSIYNQQANTVDCEAYGENLKGAVARLGNIEKTKTYMLPKVSQIPEVGTLVDEDYYISVISVENEPDYIKVTCGLSKDFNRLNKFIGIKNNLRMYEVSEKQSVQRYVIYEDYCVIGDSIDTTDTGLITPNALQRFIDDFSSNLSSHYSTSGVRVETLDENLEQITNYDMVFPVVSLGVGNSIVLSFKFQDNYSAGNQSVEASKYGDGDEKYYKMADYVPYADYWGKFKYLSLIFFDYYSSDTLTYTQQQNLGNTLPKFNPIGTANGENRFRTRIGADDRPIYIDKDNREQINFSYQIHFVTNQKNMVIGSGISKNCGITTNGARSRSLYILQNKIGKFDKDIDLTTATLVRDYDGTGTTYFDLQSGADFKQIYINDETAIADGKAWAIVDNFTNANGKHDLIFGKNLNIKDGDTISMPTMSFTHKIFD